MSKKIKILAVDDEQRNLRILQEILEDDYRIETANDGHQALDKFRSFKPDIVLLDVMMPEMDGITVCKKIRKNPDHNLIKIIFISAKTLPSEREKGYAAGADDYLIKPFGEEEVVAKVKIFSRIIATERSGISLKADNERLNLLNGVLLHLSTAAEKLDAGGTLEAFYEELVYQLMMMTDASLGSYYQFDLGNGYHNLIEVILDEESNRHCTQNSPVDASVHTLFDGNSLVNIKDINTDIRAAEFCKLQPELRGLLGIQIFINDDICGALYLGGKKHNEAFSIDDEIILKIISKEVAYLIQRHDLLVEMKSTNLELQHEKQEQRQLILKLKEAKEQLLQSEKMASIGQLAAGVAHEINNPVGYISSNLATLKNYINELFNMLDAYESVEERLENFHDDICKIRQLKEKYELDYLKSDVPELLKESLEGTNRVRQIVKDLKDFSHEGEVEFEYADIHKGIDSTLNIAHNEIKYKANIVKEYGDLPNIECIAPQLNQVFMNILVNAAHAIENRGTITISTGTEKEQVWIRISDTGKGITAEHLTKVFDPFFTTKPIGKGTGLGLSLSYGIVSKHGGHIEVDSKTNNGTAFTIWLPIQQAANTNEHRKPA